MWARVILGALLVAMGAGKLSDVDGYARALAAFRLVPEGVLQRVAWAWLTTELVAGTLLLVGAWRARRRPSQLVAAGALLALVVNVAYAVLTTQAYARHLAVDNCTCFGVHLRQRLGWLVLVQDAYMVALSAWVLARALRRGDDGAARATARSPAGSRSR